MSNAKWGNNAVQFPRLLAEIMATQELDMEALAESMDLSIDQVSELFDRADEAWEHIKANGEPLTTLNLNIFDDEGKVVDSGAVDMSLSELSDVVSHATQLTLVGYSGRRSSGDTDAIIDRLEKAVDVSGAMDSFRASFEAKRLRPSGPRM